LAEFDFRINNFVALGVNDDMRAERAIKGAEGKRLQFIDRCNSSSAESLLHLGRV